jgi:glucose/arabinose dehydrogenase
MFTKIRALSAFGAIASLSGAANGQTILLSDYFVETVVAGGTGLSQPTTMAFIGPNDFLILEKATGRVKRYTNGVFQNIVLDLPVNASSERGLLGICLHPDFPTVPKVYLYYSRALTDGGTWLDNRVERFDWDGTNLTLDIPIIVYPSSGTQSNGPNHDGGIIMIGPDNKLYVVTGDLNRGRFSNPRIEQNTSLTAVADVGGIDRLELDGSTPVDNPFFNHSDSRIRKYFAYGIRNSYGMCYDPLTNKVWITDNGPNQYDEINYVEPGFNGGWLKIMGPDSRNATYSENHFTVYNASDLTMLPGAHYRDPEFSWLAPIGVTSIRFLSSDKFLPNERNGMIVGDNNTGSLFFYKLKPNRDELELFGGTVDKVADNTTEREQHRIGLGWGVTTDLVIGPDGYLYVVSLSAGAVRRIRPAVEIAYPTSVTVGPGVIVGGDVNSLREDDGNRLSIRETPPIALGAPSARATVFATSPSLSPIELKLIVQTATTGVPASSVTTRILMFNFQTNTYDLVDSRPGTTGDTEVEVTISTNTARYINQTTREMRMRVEWVDPGSLFSFGWQGRIDLVNWRVRIQ